jgi:poly(A) polymerase
MHTNTHHIISRSSHNISRKLLSPNALRIMYRLRDNGFTARLVGGAVRDILIGRTPKDFDIVTDATPEQMKRLFRNCRLVGRRFRLAHLHFKDEIIEVATFRASGSGSEPDEPDFAAEDEETPESSGRDRHLLVNEDGMLLRDNLFGTPHEDAWRRDFTVNALSYDIADFAVIDYVGGIADLEARIIRTIGDPWSRFTEDPVRMLRAVRLSAQLDFTIEKVCWQAMTEMADRITLASPARLFDELLKLFFSGAATVCYRLLETSGLLAALLPDFHAWLQENGDATVVRRLTWLDTRAANGRATSPQLFLAAFFGEYFDAVRLASIAENAPYQVRLDAALAAFMQETAERVLITQRTLMKLREVMLLGSRLVQVPGRKPQNVVARPGFLDALEYLHLRGESDRELARSARWWERYAGDNVMPPLEKTTAPPDEPRRRKRRPRRRRRPQQQEQ